jgi:hypothetical protein
MSLNVPEISLCRTYEFVAPDAATVTKTNLWKLLMSTPVPPIDAVATLPDDCNWLDEEPGLLRSALNRRHELYERMRQFGQD